MFNSKLSTTEILRHAVLYGPLCLSTIDGHHNTTLAQNWTPLEHPLRDGTIIRLLAFCLTE